MRRATRAETWARLAAAGIVQGALPAPRARSPWYVRLMQGGSGWAAALPLLMFAGGMFAFLFESDAAMLSVGVAACVAAAFVFRRRPDSDFAAQLGFAVSLAGQVLMWMSCTVCSSSTASSWGRWKELRPMIVPNPPPSAVWRFSSSTSSTPLAAPPEKITMRRPSKAPWMTCFTRSASVSSLTPAFSSAAVAFSSHGAFVGGLTLMTSAPSWAAICAA